MTSTMSAAGLAIMAVVVVGALAVWLILVFLAGRQPPVRHSRGGEPGSLTDVGAEDLTPHEELTVPPLRAAGDGHMPQPVPAAPGRADEGEAA